MLINILRLLVLTLILVSPQLYCEEEKEFKDVESFLRSLKSAQVISSAEGDLYGKGRPDWAGIVLLKEGDNEEIMQVFVLENAGSGKYKLVGKSFPRSQDGGTGHFGYEGISIDKNSIYVSFSYHWHSCAGNSTSQFKLTRLGWQLIGVESFETNAVDGSGVDLSSSTNLLTNQAVIKKTEHEKSKVSKIKIEPQLILLKDFNGDGTISMHGAIC